MALVDAFNRNIDELKANTGSLGEMKDLIRTLMTGNVGVPTVRGGSAEEKNTAILQEMADLLKKIDAHFAQHMQAAQDFAQASKTANDSKKEKGGGSGKSPIEQFVNTAGQRQGRRRKLKDKLTEPGRRSHQKRQPLRKRCRHPSSARCNFTQNRRSSWQHGAVCSPRRSRSRRQ